VARPPGCFQPTEKKSWLFFNRLKNSQGRFQPGSRLTNEGASFRRFANGRQTILLAPAYRWLTRLP